MMTEADLKSMNIAFERMKKRNLNHNPNCPYSFTLELMNFNMTGNGNMLVLAKQIKYV